MYSVVLIEKDSKEQIGELGDYDSFDDAKIEAEDYNRKGDRHRGHAVVQTVLKNRSASAGRRGLRIKRNPSSIPSREIPSRAIPHPSPTRHSRTMPSSPQGMTMKSRESAFTSRARSPQRSIEQQIPRETPRQSIDSSPSTDVYVLIWDDILNKPMILKDSSFTRQMIMAGIGRYEIMQQGEFYDIVRERNRLSKHGRG